jgi:hypothetical protein
MLPKLTLICHTHTQKIAVMPAAAAVKKQPQAVKKSTEAPVVPIAKASVPVAPSATPPQIRLPQYFTPNQSLESTLVRLSAVWGGFSLDTQSIMEALQYRFSVS